MTSPVVGKVELEVGIDTGDIAKKLRSQLRDDLYNQVLPQISKMNDELHKTNKEIGDLQNASFKDLAKQISFVVDEQKKIVKAKEAEARADRELEKTKNSPAYSMRSCSQSGSRFLTRAGNFVVVTKYGGRSRIK